MSTVHYIVLIDNENKTYDTSLIMKTESVEEIDKKIVELKQEQLKQELKQELKKDQDLHTYYVYITKTDDNYDGYVINNISSVSKIAEAVASDTSVKAVELSETKVDTNFKWRSTEQDIALVNTYKLAPNIKQINEQINQPKYKRREWFLKLFGFKEHEINTKYIETKKMFTFNKTDGILTTNNTTNTTKDFKVGTFSCPTLSELRKEAIEIAKLSPNKNQAFNTILEHRIVGDVLEMHYKNHGATFQAASQFNCLEFMNDSITPEDGVTYYYGDLTQGPACALACAAGTVVRNYFAEVKDKTGNIVEGQTADNQINNLDEIETYIDNTTNKYWTIKNGYTSTTREGLQKFDELLKDKPTLRQELLDKLKIGVHRDVGVTFKSRFIPIPIEYDIRVTQVYASAPSVAYSNVDAKFWTNLAKIILDGAYEATVWAGVINAIKTGNKNVYLTLLGGGVFGNENKWIADAIGRAAAHVAFWGADIKLIVCHYKSIDQFYTAIENPVKLAYDTELVRLTTELQPVQPVKAVEPAQPAQQKIILLNTGAYAPVHKSHVQMIANAIEAVKEKNPGADVTALMSPSHKNYVGEKIKDESLKVFAEGPIRIELCKQLVSDMGLSDKIEVVNWESTQTNFVDYPEVIEKFKKMYNDATIMYIMGADNYKRIDEDLRDPGVPIVVVPRKNANDTDITFDLKQGDIQSAVTDNALLSSTELRKNILENNWEKVQELTSENVMQMIKKYLHIN